MTLAARIAAGFQSVAADIKQLYSSVMTPAEKALLSDLAGAVDSAEVAAIAAEQSATAVVATHEAAPNPHPQYAVGNTTALTYTYTGVLSVPPIALPGTTELMLGSPTGKERVNGLLLSSTNMFLTGIEFPALEFVAGNFTPFNLLALTRLSAPALTSVAGNFNSNTMPALTSLSLPSLTTVGGQLVFSAFGALSDLNLPALTSVLGNFSLSQLNALTNLSLPALTTVVGSINPTNLPALTSLSLPSLTTTGSFSALGMNALTDVSLPALTTVGSNFSLSSMPLLTSVSAPALEFIGGMIMFTSATPQLTTFELPATLKQVDSGVRITSAALNQTSVDSILARLAALDGTNGTVAFSNRTVTITGTSAAPSETGLVAKATLVARGCTVTHN